VKYNNYNSKWKNNQKIMETTNDDLPSTGQEEVIVQCPPLLPEIHNNKDSQKATRDSQKVIWIITHGASGPYITIEMLHSLGQIEADECHSTKDRCMNYTYIHLIKRVRQTSIDKFMERACETHGIIKNEIFGYEAISGNTRKKQGTPIEEHIGFQMLVRHYEEQNASFTPCTDGEPILKRGLIFQAAEIDPDKPLLLESQSKTRIIAYVRKLEVKAEASKKQEREMKALFATYTTVSEERSSLRVENAILKRKIQDLEERQGT
jgi:hypothetical protein